MIKCDVCHKFKDCREACKGQVESVNCITTPVFFKNGRCSLSGGLCYLKGNCTIDGCRIYKTVYATTAQSSVKSMDVSIDKKVESAVKLGKDMNLPVKVYIIDELKGDEYVLEADISTVRAKLTDLTAGIFFDHTETRVYGGHLTLEDDRYVCLDIFI